MSGIIIPEEIRGYHSLQRLKSREDFRKMFLQCSANYQRLEAEQEKNFAGRPLSRTQLFVMQKIRTVYELNNWDQSELDEIENKQHY